MDKKLLMLYAVTDRSWLNGKPLTEVIDKALKGGVTLLQLREKTMPEADFIKSAQEIKQVCQKHGVPLIINDNVNVALAVDADGVHLGQGDMPISKARQILGKNKIIGITAKTVEQARDAEKNGADYLGSGAVFGTSTKSDAKKMELEMLRKITSAVKIPIVAIGGITAKNVTRLKNTGISGAAVVSGIFAEDNVEEASRQLLNKIKQIVTED